MIDMKLYLLIISIIIALIICFMIDKYSSSFVPFAIGLLTYLIFLFIELIFSKEK